MTTRKQMLGAKYSHEEYQEVLFLYKHFNIETKTASDALRNLTHAMYSLLIEEQKQSESSKREDEELRLLEGWECGYGTLIWPFNKSMKKREPKIFCTHPTTRENLKTNELYIAVCRNCYDNGGSTRPLSLPAPKQAVSKPTPKQKQVKRFCEDCKIADISKHPSHHTRCYSCYYIWKRGVKSPGDDGYGDGVPGSQVWIRKQRERMKKEQQSKEE